MSVAPDPQSIDEDPPPRRDSLRLLSDTTDKPTIRIVAGELPRMVAEAEAARVCAKAAIFRRGSVLLRPVVEELNAAHCRKTHMAQLARVEPAWLRIAMARAASWKKFNIRKKDWMPCDPPHDVTATLLANFGEWRFLAVAGVVTTPTLRPDGTILSAPGYDAATRLVLMAPLALPDVEPTRDNAERALQALDELLREFPFADDASRSVALSALITPVCRAAFQSAPMHAATAPVSGSGKSYLADVASFINTGQLMPVMAAGRTEEETEKRLGAALLCAQPLISIDNVNGELGGDFLCQVIERPVVDVRILGRSEKVRVEARGVTMFATGNNLTLVGDMCRRAIVATLDPQDERPEFRPFTSDPVAKVLADRGYYVAAALTVVRAYLAAGSPDKAPRLASFEGWSDRVRSALLWLGRADPCDTMERARANDPRLVELRDMLACWAETFGVGGENRQTLPAVIKVAEEQTTLCRGDTPHADFERIYSHPKLRDAVLAVATSRGHPNAKTFGFWMRRHKGRVVNGLRFQNLSDAHGHAAEWYVEKI